LEKQPPTQEKALYDTYTNKGFAYYQYLLIDVKDSEKQPTLIINKLPSEVEKRENAKTW